MFLDEAQIVSLPRAPEHRAVLSSSATRTSQAFIVDGAALRPVALERVGGVPRPRRAAALRHDRLDRRARRGRAALRPRAARTPTGRRSDIVHRDVNATNIFVTYDGDIKIIDFGLAKAANRASKTAAGIIKGKVAYMSPEQAVGAPVDRRTDVFALGRRCGSSRATGASSSATTRWRRSSACTPRRCPTPRRLVAGFPPALWAILRRALAREAAKTVRGPPRELARELDAFAGVDGELDLGGGRDARALRRGSRAPARVDCRRERPRRDTVWPSP